MAPVGGTTLRQRAVQHLQELYTVVAGIALTLAINILIDPNAKFLMNLTVFPYLLRFS